MDKKEFQKQFSELTDIRENPFHPLVWINGDPQIGENVCIGGFSEINANGTTVKIGNNCDIASFVAINAVDSHKQCIGIATEKDRNPINIEHNVFVGSHSVIKGGANIGHHSVIAAGTIVDKCTIPPYSLVYGNPMQIKENYYKNERH